ncbi:MAG: hypothetical protein ACC654_02385 [Acidimicrobiia bacterium]
MTSTWRTPIVLLLALSFVTAACTSSNDSQATGESIAAPAPETSTLTGLRPVTTSTVYDLENIDFDDFYLWAERPSEWDAFLEEAGANCETTVVSLSTMAGTLTTQLDKTLAMVEAGVNGEVPVEDVVEALERYASAVEIGSISAKRLSQQKSIENAHAYAMLVRKALRKLLEKVQGLGFTAVDSETGSIRTEAIDKWLPRVVEAGESLAELVYRPPEWECPYLRP